MIKKSFGFTLIEMMITVAILAILASIAIPSYQRYVQRSWVTKAKSAMQENILVLERTNMRNWGYTTTRGVAANKLQTSDLPIQNLCDSCAHDYAFRLSVPDDDLSQFILVAYPTGEAQKDEKDCGAMIATSSGRQLAVYNSAHSYAAPTFPTQSEDYSDVEKLKSLFTGADVTSRCY